MSSEEIRLKFRKFFEERGHAWVPSSSLIPDDPSVLFTTAGMQQFKRYFTGELDPMKDFGKKNTVSIQKCFRTSDIDEVGDESHLTFFEMLGNFSFGGYWKEDAIRYGYDFITKEMDLKIDYVSVFKGDADVPADEESAKIWKSVDSSLEIRLHGREDNFWGPTGAEGPCGPTTEIYVGGVEVWNIVFNEYYSKNGKLTPLEIKGVDTGMGLERLAVMSQGVKNVYETDELKKIISSLPNGTEEKTARIIADHARGIVFLLQDGVVPSNKEAGYILRRLMRRYIFRLHETRNFEGTLSEVLGIYKELDGKKILFLFNEELEKFLKTLAVGLGELKRMDTVGVSEAFMLFQSYGLPFEVIKDYAKDKTENLTREAFDAEFAKHQEISRAGAEKKFGGHGLLLDTGELKAGNEEELKKVTCLHTATHLLNQALRETLGEGVEQRGSDITPERARFDFTFGRKMTPEEIQAVEEKVNAKIREKIPVSMKEMPKEEAEKTGALHFFKGKYPDTVSVYYISPDKTIEHAWSKEFCGGPHVKNTEEIGGIKILKEEASSAGVRRIRIALA